MPQHLTRATVFIHEFHFVVSRNGVYAAVSFTSNGIFLGSLNPAILDSSDISESTCGLISKPLSIDICARSEAGLMVLHNVRRRLKN